MTVVTRARAAMSAVAVCALTLTACTAGSGGTAVEDRDPVTLTVASWTSAGIDAVVDLYQEEYPHVTIELTTTDYTAHHDSLRQTISAGVGAPHVAVIDEGFITGFAQSPDDFVNLLDYGAAKFENNYHPWKWQQSANPDGSYQMALGGSVGGLALCYRRDLFAEAGLPTDRQDVWTATGDTWEGLIELGKQYLAATGDPFFDDAAGIANIVATQDGVGYFTPEGELTIDGAEDAFATGLSAITSGTSAGIPTLRDEWNEGLTSGTFAVTACPSWMVPFIANVVQEAESDAEWDITELPGPGGNWGGNFYAIPNQADAETLQEAYRFVEWLAQGDQQLALFQAVGAIPAQTALYVDEGIQSYTFEAFNDAPIGQIFAKSADDLNTAIWYAPRHNDIRSVIETVLTDIQAGSVAPADGWERVVAAAQLVADSGTP